MFNLHIHVQQGVAGVTGQLYVMEYERPEPASSQLTTKIQLVITPQSQTLDDLLESTGEELFNVGGMWRAVVGQDGAPVVLGAYRSRPSLRR